MLKKRRIVLRFKRIDQKARLPAYAHIDDAGFDLYSIGKKIIRPGEICLVPLGIASEIPGGWYVEIRDKSGLAINHGLHVLAGAIDSGYRGEWKVVLANFGKKDYKIVAGEKVAQGVLMGSPQAKIIEVQKLKETQRGSGGFGSTGRK